MVDRELDGLRYKRPADWFKYLNDRVNLNRPTDEQIERLAEIKASRDILVHNRRIANETYRDKAGTRALNAAGQRLAVQELYLRDSSLLIRTVVEELSTGAIAKA